MMFGEQVDADIRVHALEAFPQEACGVVTASGYRRCRNVADDPVADFKIAPAEYLESGEVLGVAHSHPNGVPYMSASDMAGQLRTAVPWALTWTDGVMSSPVLWWGDECGDPPPLEGREFRPGPSGSDGKGDCGALVRDFFRLEKGVTIPDFPREWGWWQSGRDLYFEHFAEAGFERVSAPEPDDLFLLKVRSPVYNHAGILRPDGHGLHHLQWRLSRSEPIHMWLQHAPVFLRYRG